jgi:adenine phosphoribosyltransferase
MMNANTPEQAIDFGALIRDVPDFPKPGVLFKDITTLIKNGPAFRQVIDGLAAPFAERQIDRVVGMESRGFIFGGPVAYLLGAGFVPVRKEGKLPAVAIKREYALEYGTNALEMHLDAIDAGQRVLIVDDVLATGGTAAATAQLVESLGGTVVGMSFVVELTFLSGRDRLPSYELLSLVRY